MKYKDIELKHGTDAELLINVKVLHDTKDDLYSLVADTGVMLYDIINDSDVYISIERVTDDMFSVRCDDITLNRKGVELLTKIYDNIIFANITNIEVTIGVHIDEDGEWFMNEDGIEYNEEDVPYDMFIENLVF